MRWVYSCLLLLIVGCGDNGDSRAESIHIDNRNATSVTEYESEAAAIKVAPGGFIAAGQSHSVPPTDAAEETKAVVTVDVTPDISSVESDSKVPPPVKQKKTKLPSSALAFWAGLTLLVVGGGLAAAKRSGAIWAIAVPKGMGVTTAAIGAGVMVLPWFLDEYGWIVGAGAGVVVLAFVIKYVYNIVKPKLKEGKHHGGT